MRKHWTNSSDSSFIFSHHDVVFQDQKAEKTTDMMERTADETTDMMEKVSTIEEREEQLKPKDEKHSCTFHFQSGSCRRSSVKRKMEYLQSNKILVGIVVVSAVFVMAVVMAMFSSTDTHKQP